mmetsp:Transcript_1727/g.3816  ORF Transcript_1727/g.3816 Transcript_1727/m.3816 type:complete len:324 (+) Transcript_1727:290-1261(+)|eukprot:CAMPEP_0206464056 /NCGR_PEP_ID=MMETSP0324_2-20121206/26985_1 /ASSEMBLY_ACC=CAM_ASM_000836 /TAXON_ID=2866 /ORGANISM="Crypthecodinium cohnii, Strain Seligo" /LENGTH=323 /DNA_ID=CAMNT_0053936607 /DNA_START=211 /DNA_END=1182 /DNA_ORIENTATION=+
MALSLSLLRATHQRLPNGVQAAIPLTAGRLKQPRQQQHPRCLSYHFQLSSKRSFASEPGQQIDPKMYNKVLKNGFPMFDEVTRQVQAQNPASVLDLGTGPGEPSLSIAKVLPNTAITATDFQAGMVEQAKVRCEGYSNISFGVCSADDLSEFPTSSFEAVTMVYTLMFVPDRNKCLSEIARVLKPGGRAYIGVWKDFKFFELGRETLAELNNGQKPTPCINPMALSAPNAVEDIVARTPEVSIYASTEVVTNYEAGSAEDACAISLITMKSELERLEAEGVENVQEKYNQALLKRLDDRGYKTESGSYIIKGCLSQVLTIVKA